MQKAGARYSLLQKLTKDIDIKWALQPRLGISHPITENAAMHYSWGKFYSPRSFASLYDNYGVFSNPSLHLWPGLLGSHLQMHRFEKQVFQVRHF